MDNSYKFFENTDCQYYPCHEGLDHINCLFCYCPLYNLDNCPGNPEYKEKDGRRIKICSKCTFPHKPENYDKVIGILKNKK
ncbi:MAG: cysteine-rich small domain-containing protein [Eubacterium sp.]|nr:cysteine-rich small domain-containing protein [Eubacterium sp.]